jgi:hypothetical protein
MQDDKHKREGQSGTPAEKDRDKGPAKDPRRDRLKLALRENLKRRKLQARGRGDVTIAPSNIDRVSPHEDSEKKPGK